MSTTKDALPSDKRGDPRAPTVSTLLDVARLAGVSTSTAGRVLRGSALPVAALVAERVRKVAAELGYVPNVLARNLRGAQPKMVGLIVGNMLDPYYGEIAEVVTESAESRHGLLAIVCNMRRDPHLELKYCRQLWEHRVAGLILSGGGFDQHLLSKELSALALSMQGAGVVVTTLGPRFMDTPVFSVENEQVGRVAAEYLLAAGHRNVGVITGPSRSETARLRLEGTLAALSEHGATVAVHHAKFTLQSVTTAIAALLHANPGMTGILAGSDYMARGIIEWLNSRGVLVPQHISVIGIGKTPLAAISPRLTTVDIQLAACSRAALEHIATIGKASQNHGFTAPPVSVVEGSTVAILG